MTTGKRHFLFLQGNATPFYRRLGQRLAEAGHHVSRINVGGGDYLFWGDWNALNWRGTPDELISEMPSLIRHIAPTDLILFGDCRPIHRAAIETAKQSSIRVNVFEEGYLRPHWITLECDGVNGYSRMPRDPAWYLNTAQQLPPPPPVLPVGGGMRNRVMYDFAWQLANYAFLPKFPGFRTHRPYPIWREYATWLRRLALRPQLRRRATALQEKLVADKIRYFLFPLQLDTDSQIRVHCQWQRMVPVIEHVVTNFAQYAPSNTKLVVKNHPLDNGMIQYEKIVEELALKCGIYDRVHFIDGGDLDRLTAHAAGVVTVNSTAAISGLLAGIPTIALGKAIFDLSGLTFQQGLAAFWSTTRDAAGSPHLLAAFLQVLSYMTLINGNFYTNQGITLAIEGSLRALTTSRRTRIPLSPLLCDSSNTHNSH
jgi:capsular polysaccharide export protein